MDTNFFRGNLFKAVVVVGVGEEVSSMLGSKSKNDALSRVKKRRNYPPESRSEVRTEKLKASNVN
jgi:hypothetical protein